MNILEYLQKENRTFDELAPCDPDFLVLSQFSYWVCEKDAPLYIKDMDDNFSDNFYSSNNNKKFVSLITNNPRFNSLKIINYMIIKNPEVPEFFRGYNIQLFEDTYYVSMGGTGGDIADWKEDFEMSYNAPVPSQKDAYKFLLSEMKSHKGSFIVGGHSKGGNLAEYASMTLPKELQDRIINIYSFDGPGFMISVRGEEGYKNIRERIKKFIPTSSIVGMLLETDDLHQVVECSGIGLMQHSAYSFEINGNEFVPGKFSKMQDRMNKSFAIWLDGKNEEERREFTEIFFSLAEDAGIENLEDLGNNFPEVIGKIFELYNSIDKEKKEYFEEALKDLQNIWFNL